MTPVVRDATRFRDTAVVRLVVTMHGCCCFLIPITCLHIYCIRCELLAKERSQEQTLSEADLSQNDKRVLPREAFAVIPSPSPYGSH